MTPPSASRRRSTAAAASAAAPLLLTLLLLCGGVQGDGDWKSGRATWYDDSPWMSVHKGSCMYGYLGDRFGGVNNWHVAAMNDGNPEFDGPPGQYSIKAGSCGHCYEMQCAPGVVTDGLGQSFDRTHDCKSQDSVFITITDSCPCDKSNNAYSNRRWCCGDNNHFDVGIWAFRSFADPGKGVVPIRYRRVSCDSAHSAPPAPVTAMQGKSDQGGSGSSGGSGGGQSSSAPPRVVSMQGGSDKGSSAYSPQGSPSSG